MQQKPDFSLASSELYGPFYCFLIVITGPK